MSPIAHGLLPLFFGHRWIPQAHRVPSLRLSGLIALSGVLPDILSPHFELEARHEALSHSLTALAAFTVLVFALCLRRASVAKFKVGALCVLAYGGHIYCDLITGGVGLYLPFDGRVVGGIYLPYWAWTATDFFLMGYIYFIHRWRPLRSRLKNTPAALSAQLTPPPPALP
jgi:membrane-bound metal-dependent hydrolase YbcI (DUF457 family)